MGIDVEELQMFDGIASCANHTINFKIGKFILHNFNRLGYCKSCMDFKIKTEMLEFD